MFGVNRRMEQRVLSDAPEDIAFRCNAPRAAPPYGLITMMRWAMPRSAAEYVEESISTPHESGVVLRPNGPERREGSAITGRSPLVLDTRTCCFIDANGVAHRDFQ